MRIVLSGLCLALSLLPQSGADRAAHGAACTFRLDDGFNMSYLRHFADYTGGNGGRTGPLNSATLGALIVAPAPKDSSR